MMNDYMGDGVILILYTLKYIYKINIPISYSYLYTSRHNQQQSKWSTRTYISHKIQGFLLDLINNDL